ncbi:MAG: hydroxyethylthiazole kinase [Tissierellia bacterium]|nr:hydroxyethylthiazole kinase [Tissierellia bacterium]
MEIKDLKDVRVHCITNYITSNLVANSLMAIGATPFIGDDPDEVKDLTKLSDSLIINIGTLNFRTIRSMLKSGLCANLKQRPIVFLPVNIFASNLRRQTAETFLKELKIDVILGDFEEIYEVYKILSPEKESEKDLTEEEKESICRMVSERQKCTVIMVSDIDIVADDESTTFFRGEKSPKVYGYKCIYGALVAAIIGTGLKATDASKKAAKIMFELKGKLKDLELNTEIGLGNYNSLLINEMQKLNL